MTTPFLLLICLLAVSVIVSIVLSVILIRNYSRIIKHDDNTAPTTVNVVAIDTNRRELTVEFLNLHAHTLNNFDKTISTIRRKVSAGQLQDVKLMLTNESMIADHVKRFNQVFDRLIFTLYPDFIDLINDLLADEHQVNLTDPTRLTTELRVLAFSCIGLDDTTTISRFLRLSPNTIYTYRNRMRSHAKDRDSFDGEIERIARRG
ncbi:MAG: DUF6377 domain-containing protein [Bacteroides sp.]|nr:DUF6377 domain-containing protein [Bacteroides sp.]MCM1414274.1 DUF6377 domain-containing protein [Bacteroides sp.]MCM1470978.1 DUF6377 domain-containing protein [Bacteroides sp.]